MGRRVQKRKRMRMRQKLRFKSLIAVILAITMLLTVLPVQTFAADTDPAAAASAADTSADAGQDDDGGAPSVLYELTEKRSESTKYFKMSDGSVKACTYPVPVHFADSVDGTMREIDNRLEKVTGQNGKTCYRNKENSVSVTLPEDISDGSIEYSDDKGFVSFKLRDSLVSKLKKRFMGVSSGGPTAVQNIISAASYKSVGGDTDIEYEVSGSTLKETIVLNSFTGRSFSFDLDTDAAWVIKSADGSILFYGADGNCLYTMAAPYMVDDGGEYSAAVNVTLLRLGGGKYIVTYTPDREWLADPVREYPVRLDPTITKFTELSEIADTYVFTGQKANETRGETDIINVGMQKLTNRTIILRSLIKFSLPSDIKETDCIVDAKLNLLHSPGYYDKYNTNGLQVDLHELTAPFNEITTVWDTRPDFYDTAIDYAFVNKSNMLSDTGLSYDSFNITKLACKWQSGAPNNGVLLKMHDENANLSSSSQVFYISSNSTYFGDVGQILEVTYRNTVGLEDYWSYTDQSLGGSGSGYVNNSNGNLVYTHTTAANNTANTAFTVTHIYNSALKDENDCHYGRGWRLNLRQTLKPVDNGTSVKFIYTDGDGTEHYIVQTSDGKRVDEDGLGLTLEDVTGVADRSCKLTDKSGTELVFDTHGNLCEIYDANRNLISIVYAGGTLNGVRYITGVTTSTGENFNFSYDSSGYLLYIDDNAGRRTTMSYTGGYLTGIAYPDGTATSFAYSDGRLYSVTAPSGHKLQYTYASGRVSKTEAFGENGASAGWTAFAYSSNQTVITNADGDMYTYQFDTLGRAVAVYDKYDNICTKEFTGTSSAADSIRKNNKTSTVSGTTTYVNNLLRDGMFYQGFGYWSRYGQPGSQYELTELYPMVSSKTVKVTSDANSVSCVAQTLPDNMGSGTYTLSGYIKTENVQGGSGAIVEIQTSTEREVHSEPIFGTTDSEVNGGYRRVYCTITLEPGETLWRVMAGTFYSTGTVYINGLQLEKGDSANNVNLIDNSSFELPGNGTIPEGFNGTISSGGVVSGDAHDGSRSVRINCDASNLYHIRQSVMQDGKAGEVYTFGGWAKASSTKRSGPNNFGMTFMIINTDGTVDWEYLEFNRDVETYQCASKVFVLKKDCSEFVIHMAYSYNLNSVYYDSMFLYKDTAQSYVYDSDGNVVSTADSARSESSFEYSDNSLSKLISPIGQKYTYNYDSKKNMVYGLSSAGIGYNAVYDSFGNAISGTTIADTTGSPLKSGKYYYIKNKVTGKCLYAVNPSANYGDVVQRTCTGSDFEKFLAIKTPEGYYAFKSAANLDGGLNYYSRFEENTKVETDVIGRYSTNGDYNHWKLLDTGDGDGSFNLISRPHQYGGCMTVRDSSTAENAGIYLTYPNGSDIQKWYFVEVPEDGSANGETVIPLQSGKQYYIRNLDTGRFISAEGTPQNTKPLRHYQLGTPDTSCFKWTVTRHSDGTWTMRPTDSPDLFFSYHSRFEQNTLSELEAGTDELEWSHWTIEPCNDFTGAYRIQSVISTMTTRYAALDSDEKVTGEAIYLRAYADEPSQKWCFIEVGEEMRSSAEYSPNGAYLTKVTDGRGNSTQYTYDTSKGLLTSTTDAAGNTTSYTYDANTDRMLSVTSGNSTVFYAYDTYGTLQNITSAGGTVYSFTYDQFGRTTNVNVGSRTLSSTSYLNDHSSLVSSLTYGNGSTKSYVYDDQQRIKQTYVDNTLTSLYNYDRLGNLVKYSDAKTGLAWNHEYDLIGRATRSDASDGRYIGYTYDSFNRLYTVKENVRGYELKTVYDYDDQCNYSEKSGLVTGLTMNNCRQFVYNYDKLNRLTSKTLLKSYGVKTTYSYLEGAGENTTTALIKSVNNDGELLEYAYDQNGNITSIKKNGALLESYEYDALSQLTKVTRGSEVYTYAYDNAGNILSVKKNGAVIKTYGYSDPEWKDLLTSFNGQTITYDAIGNPLTYRDGMTMTWQSGRQLASINKDGLSATFAYDANGHRTQKTVNGVTTNYYWVGDRLQYLAIGDDMYVFFYDDKGTPYGVFTLIDGVQEHLFYLYNAQGDVIAIIDDYAERVVNYEYSAWGELLSVTGSKADTVGVINPFRYRGYCYDTETGLYYLNSRYYDPITQRFLNGDGYASTGQGILAMNMFTYCGNNPINYQDSDGMFWKEIGGFFKKAGRKIKKFVSSTFGAGSTTTKTIASSKKSYLPDPSPITAECGTTTSKTISSRGDSSKPISVYANRSIDNPVKSSSVGLKINIFDFTLNISLGLDNTSISFSAKNGDSTSKCGVRANFSKLKVGIDSSTTVKWDNDVAETVYSNASVSGYAIAMGYIFAKTGVLPPVEPDYCY